MKDLFLNERKIWVSLLFFCLASRLLSSIYYIEDPDSLRFVLGVLDYDVSKMQPHFPAYPVFCFIAKVFYVVTGRYALSFSLIGGIATFAIIYFTLKIARIKVVESFGLALVFILFFNPLLWLMANRYMPDLLGVALCLSACFFVSKRNKITAQIGFLIAGLLLGVRLSYAPFVLPSLLWSLWISKNKWWLLGAGLAGIVAWLIPLVYMTGWDALVVAGQMQTAGHFSEFGGTVSTEPDYDFRATKLLEGLWADGFGLYWLGRHWVTMGAAIMLLGMITMCWQDLVERFDKISLRNSLFWGCVLYLTWIFFFQNVIYKSRHVLPLLPILSLLPAYLIAQLNFRKRVFRAVALCFLGCYSYATLHLVLQHKKPSAIAQVYNYLDEINAQNLHVASTPLIKYYLAAQGIKAEFIPIESRDDLSRLEKTEDSMQLVVIGSPLNNKMPQSKRTFYHNPYVNRMWSELSVYEY